MHLGTDLELEPAFDQIRVNSVTNRMHSQCKSHFSSRES